MERANGKQGNGPGLPCKPENSHPACPTRFERAAFRAQGRSGFAPVFVPVLIQKNEASIWENRHLQTYRQGGGTISFRFHLFPAQDAREGLTHQWQKQVGDDWADLSGKMAATLSIPATLADDGSVYRCVITSSYGTTVTSDTVTLTVLAQVELPQTGDASRLWLWLTLLGASLLGLAMHWRRRA